MVAIEANCDIHNRYSVNQIQMHRNANPRADDMKHAVTSEYVRDLEVGC